MLVAWSKLQSGLTVKSKLLKSLKLFREDVYSRWKFRLYMGTLPYITPNGTWSTDGRRSDSRLRGKLPSWDRPTIFVFTD